MPTSRCGPRLAVVVLVLAAGLLQTMATQDLDAAHRAFEAGEIRRALQLYDEVLAADPDNVAALVRSAMLLSWDRRFDDALRRYDRALALRPDHPKALLERAKVLSWDRQFAAAADAFQRLLERDPGNREARLGLARTLSWDGRQREARAEYERMLEAAPHDAEALVGMGQTWAWSGNPARAELWYARALEQRPAMKEAELGLAYLELSAGDTTAADARASRLEQRFPDDRDVAELRSAVDRARAPWVRTSYDRLADTDDNDLEIYRVEGGIALAPRLDLRLGLARYEMADRLARRGSIDSLYAVLGWAPAIGHRLEFRAGTDRAEDTTGDRFNEGIGGLVYALRPGGGLVVRLGANRDSFRYSTGILDNRVVIEAYEVDVEARPADRWRVEGAVSRWDLDDRQGQTNRRNSLRAGAWREWRPAGVTLEAGYQWFFMDYRADLSAGYFDPSDFNSHLARLRVRGHFGSRRNYYDLRLEGGVQSFELAGVEVDNDSVFGGQGLLGFPLGGGVALELFGLHTDYAVQSATGFRSRQLGLRVHWRGP